MIAPLTTMVRCDAKTGKDGDRCKGSFALTLDSFSASQDEVLRVARAHAGWFVFETGVAFCPCCVIAMASVVEALENDVARAAKKMGEASVKGEIPADPSTLADETLEGGS